ncbi:MAG: TetR/AcrR family transcriptional regulator [Woeseiaceae bacterium]|nr:TetR/AcrR family transcriptional regulator [Woeseiaceae bacterium]
MGTKGENTREHILATAEGIILQQGYSGTSIEEIIGEAGITKGGFFYHFDGKKDLARKLMLRYLENDARFFGDLSDRARSLTEDPLQQFLLFLRLMAEALADMSGAHPGCLVASYTYEAQQFDEDVRQLNLQGVLAWRELFMEHLVSIAEKYPMKIEKPLEEIADMLSSTLEGGIIMSKVMHDQQVLPNQLLLYRDYIRLVFGDVR